MATIVLQRPAAKQNRAASMSCAQGRNTQAGSERRLEFLGVRFGFPPPRDRMREEQLVKK